MSRSITHSIRAVFLAFTGVLLLIAAVDSLAGSDERMGLSTCGWEGNPCVLEELVVTAPPADAPAESPRLAEVAHPVDHARAPAGGSPPSRI